MENAHYGDAELAKLDIFFDGEAIIVDSDLEDRF
jgi:hypothetical protein